jgi:hypothetical protein
MRSRFAVRLGLAFAISLAGHAAAGSGPKAVVELFTSQGCSSCPPADAYLGELAARPDLVALTLPVDYWDYLGWKDTLAQPAFTARQRAYAAARGDRQVYTPQLIVNGSAACIGADRSTAERLIGEAADGRPGLPIEVRVREEGTSVQIELGAAKGFAAAQVWLLPFAKAQEVAIGRGENSGRTITYVNVVRGMMRVGEWSGEPARFEVPLHLARPDDAGGYVVLLQQAVRGVKPGAIIGAGKSPSFASSSSR